MDEMQVHPWQPSAFGQAFLIVHGCLFMILGGGRHCERKVSSPQVSCNTKPWPGQNLNPDLLAGVHQTWTQISQVEFTVLTTTLLLLRNLTLPAKLIIHLTFFKNCRLKIEWKPTKPVDWKKIEVLFGNLCSILNISFLLTEHEGHTGDLNQ